ncbi:uncharacterized protein LOC110463993 isoform X2 [Mizuhopecten yessoensis]|uniref:uncharacterized protein LOC110463993 isoform X2 n=1 Tax=Mizuhopecten yessoensis TaxID=6573 RepID=UPI000B45845A|nr:uncharacterized protein LOC110463993 isoform X2 [Mizuhopecten yessoensis]
MVSGLLSGCVLLVAFSLYTEGKAVSLDRQKRAPLLEIQRRRWQHPRLGRKRSTEESELWQTNDSVGGPEAVDIDPALKEQYVNLFVDLLSSAIQANPERYQNFLAYPRGGRSSNPMAFSRDARAMFSYPRLGRSGAGFPADVLDGLGCCNMGVKSINGMAMCSASECCEGLQEYRDVKKPFMFTLCVWDNSAEEDKA